MAAATGLGRNGWGGALLLHDVGDELVPEGDDPIAPGDHRTFLDAMAAVAAAFWGCEDDPRLGLLPVSCRYTAFNPSWLEAEADRGWPDLVPTIAADGWRRFEGGAQGEHKMARGLMPVATHSAHWLAHPQFREAVADFLQREGQAMDEYIDELERHQPFKAAGG